MREISVREANQFFAGDRRGRARRDHRRHQERQARRQDHRAIARPRRRPGMAGELRGAQGKPGIEARVGRLVGTIAEDDKYGDDGP